MPRKPSIWTRSGRDGWFATINGKQVHLGNDHKEAEKLFHCLKAAGKPVERSALTVAALVDLYLDDAKSDVKATTWANYRWYLEQWVDHAGKRRASTLRPFDVTTWAKSRKTWNATTQKIAIALCKQWSAWSRRQGYLDEDPLLGAKSPRPLTRDHAPPDAIDQFVAAITCGKFRDFCTVLLDTGCRPGEVRSLEARQIDWVKSAAIVVGKMGPRPISLTGRSMEILARLAKIYAVGPLLRNRDGNPWKSVTIIDRFERLSAKIGAKVIPYQFRHGLWQRASKAGVDSIVIAAQLGHKNLNMLLRTYAHVDLSQTKDAVELALPSSEPTSADQPSVGPAASPDHAPKPSLPRRIPKGRSRKT